MLHLDRPSTVGERCTVSSTGKQNRRVETTSTAQLKEVATENLEVAYEALHEVRAIDPRGHPSEILIRIAHLTTNDGSGPQEQFPAGTLIKAAADGNQTRYFLGRDELEGTLSDALNLAGTKLPSPQEPSEDAVFLNHVLRHPGQSWTADPQRLADAIKTAPAAAPPPPPPLAVQNVTGQRVFMNNEASVIQAFAKVGFNLAQSPDNPKELRQDKNYFTVWIADCDTAPCKALQIRGQYLPTPMPSKARLDEWNAGKLYGRGYLSGGFVTFDMIIPIPSKGIDLDDLKESIDRFVTQSDYFYTAVTKP